MDIGTVVGALGIIVSAAFGLWGVRLTLLGQYGGELTFVWERPIALFDQIVRDLSDLSVAYKNQPVTEHLVLLKAALVNSGKLDIAPAMVEDSVRLLLPAGYKWITAVVLSASAGVSASLKSEGDGTLAVTMGLLRRGEFVRIQALAEVPQTESGKAGAKREPDAILRESLQFSHRIANTRPIVSSELYEPATMKRRSRSYLIVTAFGVLLSGATGAVLLTRGVPQDIVYPLNLDNRGQRSEYVIRGRSTGISVRDVASGENVTLTPGEFFKALAGPPRLRPDTIVVWFLWVVPGSYVLAPLLFFAFSLRRNRQHTRLRKILSV